MLNCRKCGCPGAAELITTQPCFNSRCPNYELGAFSSFSWNSDFHTVNGADFNEVLRFLGDTEWQVRCKEAAEERG